MSVIRRVVFASELILVCGCMTNNERSVKEHEIRADARASKNEISRQSCTFTQRQLEVLRSFALAEAPRLWETIQRLKAERVTRRAALVRLCKEMQEFGRDPKMDPDVATLSAREKELEESLSMVYRRLEEAYIAYKKMQATPGKREYEELMKSALEDGVREADATVARYHEMSRLK